MTGVPACHRRGLNPRRVEEILILHVHMQEPKDLAEMFGELLPIDGRPGTDQQSVVFQQGFGFSVQDDVSVFHGG